MMLVFIFKNTDLKWPLFARTTYFEKGKYFLWINNYFNKDSYFTWFKKPVPFFLTGLYMEFPLLLAVRNLLYAWPAAVDTNPRSVHRESIT